MKKVDQNGHVTTLATHLQTKDKEPNSVMGVSTDSQENIYVAVYSEYKVRKITKNKLVSVAAETSILWSPSGTLVIPNGDFWILERSMINEVRVEKITAKGSG